MKPTQINLANFYGLTRQTIASYQKVKPEIYQALKEYFIKVNIDSEKRKVLA